MEHELRERIIECVRKHKCLYDPSDVNFKNAAIKKRTWMSIASKLNEKCHTIKTKWKTVRDGYIKYKKQARAGTGTGTGTGSGAHYMWAAHLAFLDGSVRPRRPSCTPAPAPDPPALKYEHPLPLEVELVSAPDDGEPGLDSLAHQYEYLRPNKDTHDSVDHLFLSYAQTFKSLTQRTQATLKVTLAKLFSEAELSEMFLRDQLGPPPPPPHPAPVADAASQTS